MTNDLLGFFHQFFLQINLLTSKLICQPYMLALIIGLTIYSIYQTNPKHNPESCVYTGQRVCLIYLPTQIPLPLRCFISTGKMVQGRRKVHAMEDEFRRHRRIRCPHCYLQYSSKGSTFVTHQVIDQIASISQ